MNLKEKRWVIWAGIVIFLDLFLPFGLFKKSGTVSGAFLAWAILTVADATTTQIYTSGWGKKGQVS